VFGVVTQAGGAARVTSAPGQGAAFDLYFPACATATTAARRITERRQAGRNRSRRVARPASGELVAARPGTAPARILVVEDDPTLRRVILRILSGGGYEVLEADQAEAALELLEERSAAHGGDPDLSLIITDLVMPEVTGQQLITAVHERWPDLPILVASGYAGDAAAGDGAARLDLPDWATLLRKPFGVAELLAEVRRLVPQR
ncbi:MAG TPA: response regulator, partial [Gemmatimonadales bacterium]|nr:response regulator [Gemmatimonadales bacterium]